MALINFFKERNMKLFTSNYIGIALIVSLCVIGSAQAMKQIANIGRSVARNAIVPVLRNNPARSLSTLAQRIVPNRQLAGLTVQSPLLPNVAAATRSSLLSVPAMYVLQQTQQRAFSSENSSRIITILEMLNHYMNIALWIVAGVYFAIYVVDPLLEYFYNKMKDTAFLKSHPVMVEIINTLFIIFEKLHARERLKVQLFHDEAQQKDTNSVLNLRISILNKEINALTNRTEELYTKLFEELASQASADSEQINELYDQVRKQFYQIRKLLNDNNHYGTLRLSENAFIDRCEAEKIKALKKLLKDDNQKTEQTKDITESKNATAPAKA